VSAFWETTPLAAMSPEQWESLCDGCARCCLEKLEDTRAGRLFFTRVACRLLDLERCRCSDYGHRAALVPDCLHLRPGMDETFRWLPETCAYRLLHEGQPLRSWHPLVSGDPESVHRAGISVRGLAIASDEAAGSVLEGLILIDQDL